MAANYCEVGVFHQKVLIMNKYNQLIGFKIQGISILNFVDYDFAQYGLNPSLG